MKAAVQVAKKLGVCEEKYWSYIAKDIGEPLEGAYINATDYQIKAYARITNLDELQRAIVDPNVGAVMIGVEVYKGMVSDEAKRSGIVPDPSCWDRMKLLGGHAITAVGYNDMSPYYQKDGHIKIKNYSKKFCIFSHDA